MQRLSILMVAAEMNWISTSRMPGALHHAGFDVTVLAPRDALVTKSRYARRVGHFPHDCTYALWVQTLAAAVRVQHPALIVPGDDRSAELLHKAEWTTHCSLRFRIRSARPAGRRQRSPQS